MVKHTKKNKTTDGDNKKNNPNPSEINTHDKNSFNKLFWIRICIAAIGGLMATIMFETVKGEERRWFSILFMILLYLGSIFLAKILYSKSLTLDKRKIVTTGIGSYIFIYLFMWILTYTFSNIISH